MNTPPTFKPVLSHQNRVFARLQARLQQQQQTLFSVRSALPNTLKKRVKHCVIKDHRLLVYTSSATWASQLRFYSLAIQTTLNAKNTVQIQSVQMRILTQDSNHQVKPSPIIIPSAENIEIIRSMVITTTDQKLKCALLRLSQTLEKYYTGD